MDPTLLALLAQMMMSDSSSASKGTNTMQDLLFSMLLDPKFGVLTGTYDPMLNVQPQDPATYMPSPEVGMPVATNYMRGSGTMAQIASGLTSGELSYDGALRMLKEGLANTASDVYGQDEQDLKDEVSKIRDEVNGYASQVAQAQFAASQPQVRNDIYAQMGLPLPSEQYTADTINGSAGDQKLRSEFALKQADFERRKAAFEASPPPEVTIRSAGRRGSPSVAAERSTIMLGTPTKRDDMIKLAKAAGVDKDMALEWWSDAVYRAIDATTDPRNEGKSWEQLMPDIWNNFLEHKSTHTTGNPLLDAGSKDAREAAARLMNYKPDDGKSPRNDSFQGIDPAWMEQKKQLGYEQQRLDQGQRMLDYRAMGRAAAAQSLGNTPYSDAMKERGLNNLAPLLQMMLQQPKQ